ncbi:MAG: hypothetical protein Q9162_007482 [Coniocarpon cinnabarinum]
MPTRFGTELIADCNNLSSTAAPCLGVFAPTASNAETAIYKVLNQPTIPSEVQIQDALGAIELEAIGLHRHQSNSKPERDAKESPISHILSGRDRAVPQRTAETGSSAAVFLADGLSRIMNKLMKDSRIFISPQTLNRFVHIQTLLSKSECIPEIFNLYAHKPQPQLSKRINKNTSHVSPNPDAATSAIPDAAANLALDAAIQGREIGSALSIVRTSFAKTAYRKDKLIRKALPPLIGAGLTPLAAWVMAANMSQIQNGLPQETFTQIAFAGMAVYAAAVGTIGYVALTSANDQMKRVTWAIGMPLRERWVREEERAAVDRIACAWGFKDPGRWGEEDGHDWEQLKEWAGVRGMVVDKVGLMAGME